MLEVNLLGVGLRIFVICLMALKVELGLVFIFMGGCWAAFWKSDRLLIVIMIKLFLKVMVVNVIMLLLIHFLLNYFHLDIFHIKEWNDHLLVFSAHITP